MENISKKDYEEFVSLRNSGNYYFMEKNQPDIAIKYYKKALEIKDDNKVSVCLGISYLKCENFKSGWKYFEKRIDNKILSACLNNNTSEILKPFWKGEEAKDKTLFLYYEGGFGDSIMFSRFLPLLEGKFKKILFLPPKPLLNLFKNNFTNIEFLEDINISKINFDLHLPLRSLPFALKLETKKDIENFKYLKPEENKVKEYKNKYFNNNNFKIGINWQGNSLEGKNRKINLENFTKIFNFSNITFYSLQMNPEKKDLEILKSLKITDLGKTFKDFSYTAAAIENLDLVISNDTSVANLTGAMGKQGFILLPYISDWRWGTKNFSPWFLNLKLFKQNSLDNWENVFDEMFKELSFYVKY